MPQPYSNEGLDNIFGVQAPPGTPAAVDVEYDDIDLSNDIDHDGNPITSVQVPVPTSSTGAAPAPADLSQFLAQDMRFRQEEAQRRTAEAAQTQQRQREEAARQAAESRTRELDARLDTIFTAPTPVELTEEQRTAYSQSQPIIEQLARHQAQLALQGMRGAFRDIMTQNAQLADQLAETRQLAQGNPQAQLDLAVRAQVPGVDEILSRPEWAAFRDRVIPGIGMSAGDVIQRHYQSGNAAGVVAVLKSFEAQPQNRRQETPNPGGRAASGPASRPAGGRMLRMSALNEAYAKHSQGMISQGKLQQIVAQFEEAAAANLVDYDL